MESNRVCNVCSISVIVSEEEIAKAIDRLSRLKGMHFVDDATYQNRLAQCSTCCCLEHGTTCLQCGCIVQIKAKLPESTCPFPKDRRW